MNSRRLFSTLAFGWCASFFVGSVAAAQTPPMPAIPVAVSPAVERNVAAGQTFVGTVMPLRTSSVGAAVDGRVVSFPLNEGDPVKEGDTIAQLLTGQLDIELAGAKAQLEVYQSELDELKAGTRQEEKEQAEAQMLNRKAMFEYATARRKRMETLVAQGTMTQDEWEELQTIYDQARQAYVEARLAFDLAVKGPRQEKIAQAESRKAVQQQEVARIQDQINKHTIRAPFDGYLVAEYTEVGQWVVKGGLIAKVVELSDVEIEVPLPENYLPYVDLGLEAPVELGALAGQRFPGHVSVIVPEADRRSRSFPVKVRVKNEIQGGRPLIRAGMLARVTLPVGRRGNALVVPKDGLVLGGPTPVVYVFDAATPGGRKGTIRRVAVELGLADGDYIAVKTQTKDEIKAGDQIVVQGNERLRGGEPVVAALDRK